MHKNTLWLIFAFLCIYFSLVFCQGPTNALESVSEDSNNVRYDSVTTALEEKARMKGKLHHHLYSLWGFYGLAVAYLIKIKVIVVAFFVGSAVYLGLRYLYPHKCGSEIYKEGSIVLDHPPSFSHHDHIPYSLDHDHHHDQHYDSGSFTSSGPASFEPYSAYSSQSFTEPESPFPSSSFAGPDTAPDSLSYGARSFRRKRSEPKDSQDNKEVVGKLENLARQMVIKEEQIGEFMLNFLGLDTTACRRRFICEMEFRSRANPLTSLAFRVIGPTIFSKYTNNQNPLRKASSFDECATVNEECVFIENNDEETEEQTTTYITEHGDQVDDDDDVKNTIEGNDITEKENENNIEMELKANYFRKRLRGDRHLKMT